MEVNSGEAASQETRPRRRTAGALLRQEQHLISNVFELDSRIVPSAMTSRENIVFLTLSESEESIRRKIAEHPHGKFPVCEDGIDSVIGYVDSKDILPRIVQGQDLSLRTQPIVRKLLMLPDTLSLGALSVTSDDVSSSLRGFSPSVFRNALLPATVTSPPVSSLACPVSSFELITALKPFSSTQSASTKS